MGQVRDALPVLSCNKFPGHHPSASYRQNVAEREVVLEVLLVHTTGRDELCFRKDRLKVLQSFQPVHRLGWKEFEGVAAVLQGTGDFRGGFHCGEVGQSKSLRFLNQ